MPAWVDSVLGDAMGGTDLEFGGTRFVVLGYRRSMAVFVDRLDPRTLTGARVS
jgi:hypothetical protein